MKQIVFVFGLLAGGIIGAMTAIMIPLCLNGVVDFDESEVVGYTTMALAFLMVFFGIRRYRENIAGGVITFGRAFKVGILITLVASAVYVTAWEITYFGGFVPDFEDKFVAHTIDKMRESGESAAAIQKAEVDMAKFKELYKNPLINIGMTFIEIFPVGLIVTLISAAILRRKNPPTPTPAAAVAA